MSRDLHDLFKRELDQIPVRPSLGWRQSDGSARLAINQWNHPLSFLAAALTLIAALVGGQQLGAVRERNFQAASGVVAGKSVYLVPSFNGSDWARIHPVTLQTVSSRPLLDIPRSDQPGDTLVSGDGSTILVVDLSSPRPRRTIYDARTGTARGALVPEVAMVIDTLSRDATRALGRLGSAENALTDAKAIISLADGRVLARIPAAAVCCVERIVYAPDLTAVYYFITPPSAPNNAAVSLPLSLVVQKLPSGELSQPIALPGVVVERVPSPTQPGAVAQRSPGVSLSSDGKRIVVLSHDAATLVTIDASSLAVSQVLLRARSSAPTPSGVVSVATPADRESWSALQTPDGRGLIAYLNKVHYPQRGAPVRTTRQLVRIDVERGVIVAESLASEGIYSARITPDGSGVLLIVASAPSGPATYMIRRLEASTLAVSAERALTEYAELMIAAAPAGP